MTCLEKCRTRVPELAETLRQTYLAQDLKPHAPFASSREIARTFNVSLLTANRAVNLLVEEGLLYRKLGSGTYVREQQKTKTLLIGFASNLTFAIKPMQKSSDQVLQYFHEAGAKVRPIAYAEISNPNLAPQLLQDLDGLIISGEYLDQPTKENLRSFTKPMALMRYDFQAPQPFHQVVRDFTQAFDEIAAAIPDTHPLWIVAEKHRNGEYRRNEFKKALDRRGFNPEKIREILLDFTPGSDVTNFRYALKLAKEAQDAFVFCTSDVQSDIFLNAFIQQGLKPCRDFDWVSCDNLAKFGYGTPGLPGLTSVDGFSEEIAKETAIILMNQINNPSGCQIIARKHAKLVRRETARV